MLLPPFSSDIYTRVSKRYPVHDAFLIFFMSILRLLILDITIMREKLNHLEILFGKLLGN